MRILVATDAWRPQINGVVHSLEQTAAAARSQGYDIDFLTPQGFRTIPMPTYPDIKLALASWGAIAKRIDAAGAEHIHIATEGPIGFAARRYCLARNRVFTTSYHTRFPEYIAQRVPIPERWTYAALRRFHAPAAAVMVPTPTIRDELTQRGFARVKVWSRGVDQLTFHPRETSVLDFPRPIFLCVGRVAVEKNLGALLSLKLPGSTVIVGDGPARASLERQYPHAHFLGSRSGEALAQTFASADVFVFPSRTDTFGIVLIEALASGLPVAAYPVAGPLDVIGNSGAGVLSEDLGAACLAALQIPRAVAREHSMQFTWRESARQFLQNIEQSREAWVAPAQAARLGS
ncbi:glycosyltransferase family 1 protein [Methylocapsa sp. S129]|uniref:glycosyltransferase family 4 protein n=1 Tax=Methylocapsa sp. S129 TaxID=1641869 RepID=UPI00131A6606|nr:glycosyltransferase family 1 protein [Methylocapsa sp. S129]